MGEAEDSPVLGSDMSVTAEASMPSRQWESEDRKVTAALSDLALASQRVPDEDTKLMGEICDEVGAALATGVRMPEVLAVFRAHGLQITARGLEILVSTFATGTDLSSLGADYRGD